jgi:cytochrome c oxidase subunit 3
MGAVSDVAALERRTEDEEASPLGIGVVIWLASELMFFAGLFAAYFALRAENAGNWPPSDANIDTLRAGIFTTILIVSSFTMHASVRAAEQGRRGQSLRMLLLTLVLGVVFLVNQLLEYLDVGFGVDTHAYGSIFYLLTGFHGLHVAGGLVLLGVLAWVVFSRHSRIPSTHTLRVGGYYWHFVDVVWVAVFLAIYVVR